MAATSLFHTNFVTSKERDKFMFNKEFMSDCAFLIKDGDTTLKIPCHKYILGCCSWEFYNFFYLLKDESTDIQITDVSFNSVKKFVEFVYKETTELDMETVWDVLILAKRFAVKRLIIFCKNFLSDNVEDENLVEVLDKSIGFYLDDKLRTECVKVIGRSQIDFFKCFPEAPFFKLSREALIFILKSDHLDKKEIDIFRFANAWAENYCNKTGIPATSVNKRMALGDVVQNIRFGCLTIVEFNECTKNESILTDKEIINVFNHIGSNGNDQCQFLSVKRRPTNTQIFFIGSSIDKNVSHLNNDFIFSLNKPTILIGFEIFGTKTPGHLNLNLLLKRVSDKHIMYKSSEHIFCFGNTRTYDLRLNKGIVLEANKIYSFALGNLSLEQIYYLRDPKREYINAGNKVTLTIHSLCHNFASIIFQ